MGQCDRSVNKILKIQLRFRLPKFKILHFPVYKRPLFACLYLHKKKGGYLIHKSTDIYFSAVTSFPNFR